MTIISNGHRFGIEQDDGSKSAVNVKGLEIRGSGSVIIQAYKHALELNGGQLLVWNGGATFRSYAESAILSYSSFISFTNSDVSIESPTAAVDGFVRELSISGDNSHVNVRGTLKGLGQFNISGGYFNLINTTSGPATIHAQTIDFTGGKIYVTESHPESESCDATQHYTSIYCNNTINISNCSLEVYAYPYIAILGYNVNITNSKVKARGRLAAIDGNGKTGHVSLNGSLNEVVVNGKHAIWSETVNLNGGKLVAHGYQYPVNSAIINISPQAGSLFESYAYYGDGRVPESFIYSGFPFIAMPSQYTPNHSIHLQRPTSVSGTLPGQVGMFNGQLYISSGTGYYDVSYFGLPDGSPFNYVRLGVPHIHNMTGVNNPFLLQPSGMTSTKHVTPGDTLLLNLAPLEPYAHFLQADGRPVVKLVKRNPSTETRTIIVEEQVDTTNGNWNWSHTFTEQEVDCYYTVEVELDGYEGSL